MKLLINLLSADSGGARTYLANLLHRLSTLGNEIAIAHRDTLQLERTEHTFLIPVSVHSLAARLAWEYTELPKVVGRHRFDVVFTPYQVAPIISGVRNVVMLRNMEPFFHWRYPYPYRLRLRNALLDVRTLSTVKRADRVIAVSNFAAGELQKRISLEPDQLRIIPHGCAAPTGNAVGQRPLRNPDGQFVILVAGSLLPYRRIEDVLEAAAKLWRNRGMRLVVLVAGTGNDLKYKNALNELVKRLELAQMVRFVGQLSQRDLSTAMSNCDAFVFSSEVEACPNVLIEAMGHACAIVAASTPPNREFLRDGGLYYSPRDVDGLVDVLASIASSPNQAVSMGVKALDNASFYSWDKTAQLTHEALAYW